MYINKPYNVVVLKGYSNCSLFFYNYLRKSILQMHSWYLNILFDFKLEKYGCFSSAYRITLFSQNPVHGSVCEMILSATLLKNTSHYQFLEEL